MTTSKPVSVDSVAWYPYDQKMHESLLRASRFDECVDMATIVGDKLGVPREMVDGWRGTALDKRVLGERIEFALNPAYPPRNDEQAKVIMKSASLLHHDRSHIVEASTGFGKTFCALHTIAHVGRKTLVVVTKEDLLESWPKEAMKFLGLERDEIGIIQQDRCEIYHKKLVIGMVHSLAQREYPEEVKREFGLVVFDEVHHMAAETFSRVAAMFKAKLRLGYSATPQRVDGKDFVFHGHIGQVLVRAKLIPVPPKVLLKYTNWRVPIVFWGGVRQKLPHEAGKLMHVVTAMAKDQRRNQLIVNYVLQAYKKKRWTVVMSELAEDKHLGNLRQMCQDAGIPDEDMAYYVGGMKPTALEKAKTKRVVFATYGMTGEATDVPWWDCLILATPRANVKQAIGRVLREHPDKPRPIVIDLVDDDSDILAGYAKARVKQYTSDEIKGEVITL